MVYSTSLSIPVCHANQGANCSAASSTNKLNTSKESPFDSFCDELVVRVFSRLPFADLQSCAQVSKRFYRISHDEEVLKTAFKNLESRAKKIFEHPSHHILNTLLRKFENPVGFAFLFEHPSHHHNLNAFIREFQKLVCFASLNNTTSDSIVKIAKSIFTNSKNKITNFYMCHTDIRSKFSDRNIVLYYLIPTITFIFVLCSFINQLHLIIHAKTDISKNLREISWFIIYRNLGIILFCLYYLNKTKLPNYSMILNQTKQLRALLEKTRQIIDSFDEAPSSAAASSSEVEAPKID